MESGMMKVVFTSIINGSRRNLPVNEAKCGCGDPGAKSKNRFKPKIQYSEPKKEVDDYEAKTSREVFAALVNASNCANLHIDKDPDGFLTIMHRGDVIRKCR